MPWMRKLGRPTDHRLAMLRNQVSDLLWKGRIETTYAKAKEVSRIADRILSLAIDTYEDIIKEAVTVKDEKGKGVEKEIIKDGAKKLNARRKIMAQVYDLKEQRMKGERKAAFKARVGKIKHPLVEKIFNELAPELDRREKQTGQKGGYTRIYKLGPRRGDSAEMAIIELVR
ncbi:MAG: 50S ribosomal protein L17 [Clostridiales bacterium]|jgi:large subunit ribosomal protein L17|nr:50S ribosomal protein L17 [Clostridiales bacterium]